ncbi:sulfatase family protein [Roseibacillus ishigakijimensis]|uniref:Arylsulfatase n=1 Tax=Roseibacillus ishigakijimensis TaxID=454146 RepID=A0A934RN97_9BACT|nr:arylsulfatase [Roseibacillus ishigakijimensis]MBK1833948.1 arylsulfatase [Roseibacillus ishigakijimensis]
MRLWLLFLLAPLLAVAQPNIILMLSDDLGYGEIQHLNPERGKIPTPHFDELARSGMTFTDAHSASSVCTPTRYTLLTGRYSWRTRLQKGVLTGGPSLIAPDRVTLPKLLSQAGYETAIIGKWHLGMLYDGEHVQGKVAVGAKVTHGPLDRGGFDFFRGFHHARQMDVWIEDDRVSERIEPIEMLPRLTEAAVAFIQKREKGDAPFFLYLPWNSPHSPVVPTKEWQGRSGLNAHADFVMQTDDSHGRVMAALRESGLLENTLVIVSSDNGTSAPTAKKDELEKMGHFPSGDLRGSKADLWEGGHRVPFFVSWPGTTEAGSQCDDLICQSDVFATVAEIVGTGYEDPTAPDSFSFWPQLQGKPAARPRPPVVHHSHAGHFAVRTREWKLVLCPGSGGWSAPRPAVALKKGLPTQQLYRLPESLAERDEQQEDHPAKAAELRALLQDLIAHGRSTPGPKLANDAPIVLEKWRPDGD